MDYGRGQRCLRVWLYANILITIILIVHSENPPSANDRTEKERKELSKNITNILDNLVDPKSYDKRLRPNYGGPPVDVGITIYVSSISAVSEVEMDYTLDMYLRQMWQDPRLTFQADVKDLTIDAEYLKNIWLPDTFFPNEKTSFFHIATTRNSFLRITKDGNVTTSQRSVYSHKDFTLDFYLRQMWTDPRLGFREKYGLNQDLTVGVEYLKDIWVPDTFFPNEKKSFFHKATTHNSFLRIRSNGEVKTSQRLTVTANCPMQLQLFPLDSQKCSLEIESYGYSTRDIRYTWYKGLDSVSYNKVSLPQFELTDFAIREKLAKLSTGHYSRLIVRFMFSRQIGFYMIQIYLPSILIVIISWVSFWLSRDATPARVALGVTTVLTMTTLMTTTNAAMPKVSYIKSIDYYLGTCFLMVFASLLEYAAVGYLNKKLRMKREAMRKDQDGAKGKNSEPATTFGPRPIFGGNRNSPSSSANGGIRLPLLPLQSGVSPILRLSQQNHHLFQESQSGVVGRYRPLNAAISSPPPPFNAVQQQSTPTAANNVVGGNGSSQAAMALINSHHHNHLMMGMGGAAAAAGGIGGGHCGQFHLMPECDCDLDKTSALRRMKLSPPKRQQKLLPVYPSSIDKYSRIVFPLSFAAFNAMYWTIYMHISDDKLEKDANDGYTTNDINLHWAYQKSPPNVGSVMNKKIKLPQFKHDAINPYTNASIISLSSGPYSRLSVCFWFIRSIGFYMIQIYTPAILIVIISWVSFWLSRDAAPARVSLGVTTVLTMTTLMTTTNSQLPKVSYIKSIDLYLGTCFVMVFASLLEYAWVGYTNKKMKMKKESRYRKENMGASLPIEYPIPSIPSPAHFRKRMDHQGGSIPGSPLLNQRSQQFTSYQHAHQHLLVASSSLVSLECDCDIPPKPASRVLLRIKTPGGRKRIRGLTPSMIDKWSRIVFPCLFISFNATYWGVFYYIKSQYKIQAEESKVFSDILMTQLLLNHSPTTNTVTDDFVPSSASASVSS